MTFELSPFPLKRIRQPDIPVQGPPQVYGSAPGELTGLTSMVTVLVTMVERSILAHSPRLQTLLETARQQIRQGEGISHEGFWREMDPEEPGKERRKSKSKTA